MSIDLFSPNLKYDSSQKYVIFDYETCNLNLLSLDNKPWNLGIVLAQGKEILSVKNIYIKWENIYIPEIVKQLTKFNQETYNKESIPPEQAINELEKYLLNPEYRIIGHNILNFDIYIHNTFRKLVGRPQNWSFLDRCIDTNALSKAFKLDAKLDSNISFYNWQMKHLGYHARGLKSNLAYMCKELDIQIDENSGHFHSGAFDCVQSFYVFLGLLKHYEFN